MQLGSALRATAVIAVFGAAGCASSPAMRAVERSDRSALRDDLVRRERLGQVSDGEAASLALAVATREIASPIGAVDRVRELRSCAHDLDGELARRMRVHDAAGAEAALARVDGRGLDAGAFRDLANDDDPLWRAVGVRGLIRPEDGAARRRAFVDGNPSVRREAARAAREASDPDDRAALVELARVDPDPAVRTESVRAIALLPAAFAQPTADVLRDLWEGADERLREDIALAWSEPSTWRSGGRDALRTVVATNHGPEALEAAAAVLRHADADPDVLDLAIAQIVSAIESGTRARRLQAVARASLARPELAAAVRSAAGDEDLAVRVAALARLSEGNDSRARSDLEALAAGSFAGARRARLALGMAGDARAQAWVEDELSEPADEDRISAAIALAALGVAARAAPLLADASPRVRTGAACVILAASRKRDGRRRLQSN